MIPRTNRFTQSNFEAARKKMQLFRSGGFLFLYKKRRREEYRAAVVISKKVARLAVMRNRFKRQCYEIFRLANLSEIQIDLICLYKGDQIPKNRAEILFHTNNFIKFINNKTNGSK